MNAKLKAQNTQLNAFLSWVNPKPTDGPLKNMTFAAKDNLMVEGTVTTCGSKMLENYIAPFTATAVERLLLKGAALVGKTNLDEFAMGSSTEYSYFGVTRNPHDADRVAGGSSGGSAAAVASGMVDFALGSDTGGSIRQPASFCGVVGFKPSYGVVSRHGLIAMASSLDQIGTFTKNVRDAARIMDVISGEDSRDATCNAPRMHFVKGLSDSKTYTLGVVREFMSDQIDEEIKEIIQTAIKKSANTLNFKVKSVSLADLNELLAAYYVLQPAEASSNLARFDGIRFGFSAAGDKSFDEAVTQNREEGFGEEVKRRIATGTFVLSSGYQDAYYKKAVVLKSELKNKLDKLFKSVDFLVGPTTPTTAFKIGEYKNNPTGMYYQDLLTIPANLAGLPAISLPAGRDHQGLPVGLQIMGPRFEDVALLNCAKRMEQCLDF